MSSTSNNSNRRSIFGTLKKLTRKPSGMDKSSQAKSSGAPTNLASNDSASRDRSSNPFSNAAPPTRRPVSDAPPSYIEALSGPSAGASAAGGIRSASPAPSHHSALSIGASPLQTAEDKFAFLSTFDTIFLIDDSGSMAGKSWRETQDVLCNIAPICTAHDADGIDVYFLNNRNPGDKAGGFLNITDADAVNRLFRTVRPRAATPTGTRLQHILGPIITRFEQAMAAHGGDAEATGIKPVNLIVITDGVPTDDPETVLLNFAKRLDKIDAPPYQLGVQFFQVGNEPGAREALIELDDNLGGAEQGEGVRDIVDTTTWSGQLGSRPVLDADAMLKAVLGAVVKRLDRKRISLDQPGRRDRLRP